METGSLMTLLSLQLPKLTWNLPWRLLSPTWNPEFNEEVVAERWSLPQIGSAHYGHSIL